jgi:GNAT superfamily N-acetyltransferase
MTLDDFEISSDPARIDADAVHAYLTRSYWAKGVSKARVAESIAGSRAFGAYRKSDGAQVGFARVITDGCRFAYLADVYALEEVRGIGIGKALVEAALASPGLERCSWMLSTDDAHGLYRRYGFEVVADPNQTMRLKRPVDAGEESA